MPMYPIRRRPRECKTCHQCRASKVRCDRNVPCSNCIKRGFNCTYGRPPPGPPPVASRPSITSENFATSTALGTTAPQIYPSSTHPTINQDGLYAADFGFDDPASDTVSISPFEWEELNKKMRDMAQVIASMKSIVQAHSNPLQSRQLEDPRSDVSSVGMARSPSVQDSIYGSTTLKTGSVHIGNRSALHDIMDKTKSAAGPAQVLPKDDLLGELALENDSAGYPFVDLWSSDPVTFNIGGVCDVLPPDDHFLKFLNHYKDIAAVLYPVLSDINEFENEVKQLLDGRKRAAGVYKPADNGEMKPFGMSVTFLSLCFAVLASGCQLSDLPGIQREMTSWVYGMTERMCMVLGLHAEAPGYPPAMQEARRRVWWAMAFQNSHFSLAYDRPSITMISQPEIPYHRKSMPGHRSYFETLSRILGVVLESLRLMLESHHSHLRPHEIRDYVQRIRNIFAEAAPHLRFIEHCFTLTSKIERAELKLHSSYYISVLCRVSLDPEVPMDDRKRESIRYDCMTNLVNTIEAFIELHSISPYASRTWISVQRTIASAFLLIANTADQPWSQHRALLERLEKVLADHVYFDGSVNSTNRTDSAKHLSSSLEALRAVLSAFHKGKNEETTVKGAVGGTPNMPPATSTLLPSPQFANLATSMSPYTQAGLPLEDGNIGNILNQVSDVMLFPSMNVGNS